MGSDAEGGVPVWGVEAGEGVIRAVRAVRRPDGGFRLLAFEESRTDAPGPDALTTFIRKKGLKNHPLVVAIQSPSGHIVSVPLTAEEAKHEADGLRETFLEYVHAEPEDVDLRYAAESADLYTVCAEERARVESYLVALETIGVGAYSITSSLDALLSAVRRTGLFQDDGLLIRVQDRWTDLMFFEGGAVRHQGLPVGTADLSDPGALDGFAHDIAILLEYHRSRFPSDGPEQIVLTGLPDETAERLAPLLPERPIPFPGDSGPIEGKGRLAGEKALAVLRTSPGAVGAAIAGGAAPPRLGLAFRPFMGELPVPRSSAGALTVAAAALFLAATLFWWSAGRDRERFEAGLGRLAAPETESVEVSTEAVSALRDLSRQARGAAALRNAAEDVFSAYPGADAAPYVTKSLSIEAAGDGTYGIRGTVDFPEQEAGSARWAYFTEVLEEKGARPERANREDGGVRIEFRVTRRVPR